MIKGLDIGPLSGRAYKIALKHVHENILAGIGYMHDSAIFNEEYKKDIETDSWDCFPKWYPKNKRWDLINNIIFKVQAKEEYELSDLEKFVLMRALVDYYEDYSNKYTLKIANKTWKKENSSKPSFGALNIKTIENAYDRMCVLTNIIENITKYELCEDVKEIYDAVEYYMAQIEDLTRYPDMFEDDDYEFLGQFTPAQMKIIAKTHPEIGIDVSHIE